MFATHTIRMSFPTLKATTLVVCLMQLYGCDHALQIEGQGDIISASGNRNCPLESQPCENLVIDSYQETYTALPRGAWTFVRWEGCLSEAQANRPSCSFDVPAASVKTAWGQTVPLTAIFGEKKRLSELEFVDPGLEGCVISAHSVYVHEVEELNCINYRIASLSGVENLTSLRSLNVSKNDIEDLTPIASLPYLAELDISENPVLDHTHLWALDLDWLTVSVNQSDDSTWMNNLPAYTKVNISTGSPREWLAQLPRMDGVALEGCTSWVNPYWRPVIYGVERLSFEGCSNAVYPLELGWLGEFNNLRELNIISQDSREESALDIAAFKSLEKLKVLSLDLPHAPQDLAPLASLTHLEELNITAPVTDITFLASMKKLRKLSLARNTNTDFSPLAQLVYLEQLELSQEGLSDLEDITGLARLESLTLLDTGISDLSPLAELAELTQLKISFSEGVTDVGPLASLSKLKQLDLSYNAIVDVSPLAGLSALNFLWLEHNQIVNVSPLSSLSDLHWLVIGMNPIGGLDVGNIDDLAVLQKLDALSFGFWTHKLSCIELNTLIATLGDVVQTGFTDCVAP